MAATVRKSYTEVTRFYALACGCEYASTEILRTGDLVLSHYRTCPAWDRGHRLEDGKPGLVIRKLRKVERVVRDPGK